MPKFRLGCTVCSYAGISFKLLKLKALKVTNGKAAEDSVLSAQFSDLRKLTRLAILERPVVFVNQYGLTFCKARYVFPRSPSLQAKIEPYKIREYRSILAQFTYWYKLLRFCYNNEENRHQLKLTIQIRLAYCVKCGEV